MATGTGITWYGEELAAHLKKVYLQRMVEAAEYVRQAVQRNISVPGPAAAGNYPGADSGALKASIFATVDRGTLSFTVGTPLKYGLWLEFGTAGGRTITAKRGGMLSWIDPRTGQRRFARSVKQAPIRQRSFLRRTFLEEKSWLKGHFERPIPDMKRR